MFFNRTIRNKVQKTRSRTGRHFTPSAEQRKDGYKELRVALSVRLARMGMTEAAAACIFVELYL